MKFTTVLALLASASAVRIQTEESHAHLSVLEDDIDPKLLNIADQILESKPEETPEELITEDDLVTWLKRCSNPYDGLTWKDVTIKLDEISGDKGE